MKWLQWWDYARPVLELALLIWAIVLITRSHRQLRRMKDVIDDQDRQIADLKKQTNS